ncbi:hypothetical protein GUITHDRAFT_105812 [Guillardia theta CCMP2712]|uniref:Uncharacterized protein n=1 Tax=Guillardia theta (strain CCMP2712) TaxID=905079 RepID=L1JJD9_GUITC|nr:hypothetical protein GUITHDRAFT_105812 [Guillardia theta CCMP2712]EKX48205.1 hypothetical protein GUITHDRAFT_105812 [Guillardia theta CCMP2712]|eukprot:XP_005835185.1 hypothetical protein GUITHDRAFT_105812 [Guillardia theta CCMP2712]
MNKSIWQAERTSNGHDCLLNLMEPYSFGSLGRAVYAVNLTSANMAGKSLWQKYKSSNPRTRIKLGLAGICLSLVGLAMFPGEPEAARPLIKREANSKH